MFMQSDRHMVCWRCQGDSHQPAWLYLPAPLRLHVRARSSSALPAVCGLLVADWGAVVTKATGSHGGARRPQGADQELQPLLLQQLQSGKKAVRRESGHPAVELVGSSVSAHLLVNSEGFMSLYVGLERPERNGKVGLK